MLQVVDFVFVLGAQGHGDGSLARLDAEVERAHVHLHDRAHDVALLAFGVDQLGDGVDDLGDGEGGVDAVFRLRRVAGRPDQVHGHALRSGHGGTVGQVHFIDGHVAPVVQAVDLARAFFQQGVHGHGRAHAHFFGILEQEDDVVGRTLLVHFQGEACQRGRMAVMAALVGDAGILRRPGQADALVHGNRVEVRTEGDDGLAFAGVVLGIEITGRRVDDLEVGGVRTQEVDQVLPGPNLLAR